jgi:hypothetical protein
MMSWLVGTGMRGLWECGPHREMSPFRDSRRCRPPPYRMASPPRATEPRNAVLFKEWLASHGGGFHPGAHYSSSGKFLSYWPQEEPQINSILLCFLCAFLYCCCIHCLSLFSLVRTFDRSERGYRARRDHRNVPFLTHHNAIAIQWRAATHTQRRIYTRTLERTTIDHRIHMFPLDRKPKDVK